MISRTVILRLVLGLSLAGVAASFVPNPGGPVFEEEFFAEGFSGSLGWPFESFVAASDEGVRLIQSSTVLDSSFVIKNKFSPPYSHLAWNPWSVWFNFTVVGFLTLAAVGFLWFLWSVWRMVR